MGKKRGLPRTIARRVTQANGSTEFTGSSTSLSASGLGGSSLSINSDGAPDDLAASAPAATGDDSLQERLDRVKAALKSSAAEKARRRRRRTNEEDKGKDKDIAGQKKPSDGVGEVDPSTADAGSSDFLAEGDDSENKDGDATSNGKDEEGDDTPKNRSERRAAARKAAKEAKHGSKGGNRWNRKGTETPDKEKPSSPGAVTGPGDKTRDSQDATRETTREPTPVPPEQYHNEEKVADAPSESAQPNGILQDQATHKPGSPNNVEKSKGGRWDRSASAKRSSSPSQRSRSAQRSNKNDSSRRSPSPGVAIMAAAARIGTVPGDEPQIPAWKLAGPTSPIVGKEAAAGAWVSSSEALDEIEGEHDSEVAIGNGKYDTSVNANGKRSGEDLNLQGDLPGTWQGSGPNLHVPSQKAGSSVKSRPLPLHFADDEGLRSANLAAAGLVADLVPDDQAAAQQQCVSERPRPVPVALQLADPEGLRVANLAGLGVDLSPDATQEQIITERTRPVPIPLHLTDAEGIGAANLAAAGLGPDLASPLLSSNSANAQAAGTPRDGTWGPDSPPSPRSDASDEWAERGSAAHQSPPNLGGLTTPVASVSPVAPPVAPHCEPPRRLAPHSKLSMELTAGSPVEPEVPCKVSDSEGSGLARSISAAKHETPKPASTPKSALLSASGLQKPLSPGLGLSGTFVRRAFLIPASTTGALPGSAHSPPTGRSPHSAIIADSPKSVGTGSPESAAKYSASGDPVADFLSWYNDVDEVPRPQNADDNASGVHTP